MNDKDRQGDSDRTNFDLTTPNIPSPYKNQAFRPQTPNPGDDRTMSNIPAPNRDAPNRAGSANKFDLTMVNFGGGVEEDDDRSVVMTPVPPAPQQQSYQQSYQQNPQYQQQAPPQYAQTPVQTPAIPAPPPVQAKPKKGISIWIWLAVGLFLVVLLIGAGVAAWFLIPSAGFTLRVLNAPAGAKVYVDDIPSGVPQRDGTIIVKGLRTGESRDIRVSDQGFADWKTTVTGQSGQVMDVTVNMTPLVEAKQTSLPPEIDFSGKMELIAAGDFTMGANDSNAEESPAHTVTLPAYYIDKFEVTNEQYANYCKATGHPKPVDPFWDKQYFDKNPRMPVIGVSYADAVAYSVWANKRLPSEAEWEKAASWGPTSPTKRKYPWGDAADKTRANLDTSHPTVVGQFSSGASAYGVQDMAGNAREWVDGTFGPYPGNSSSNPQFGQGLRIVRGGDFRAGVANSKTTGRLGVDAGFMTNPGDDKKLLSSLVGFRCAIAADDPKLQNALKAASK